MPAPTGRRSAVRAEVPRLPEVTRFDRGDAEAVAFGLMPHNRHFVSSGLHHLYEVLGVGFTTDDVIALMLDGLACCKADDYLDYAYWRGEKLMAIVRLLPDGRRIARVMDGPRVERRVYPASKEWDGAS